MQVTVYCGAEFSGLGKVAWESEAVFEVASVQTITGVVAAQGWSELSFPELLSATHPVAFMTIQCPALLSGGEATLDLSRWGLFRGLFYTFKGRPTLRNMYMQELAKMLRLEAFGQLWAADTVRMLLTPAQRYGGETVYKMQIYNPYDRSYEVSIGLGFL